MTPEVYAAQVDARHPGMVAMMKTAGNHEVAAYFGLTRQRVFQIRHRLGIPAVSSSAPLLPTQAEQLGTRPDDYLALLWGLSPGRVRDGRLLRNIPSYASTLQFDQATLEPVLHLIGKISDPKVAAMVGVTAHQVQRFRQMHGIETQVISPRHKLFKPIDRERIRQMFDEGAGDEQIAAAVRATPATVMQIRAHELRLVRKGPNARISDDERARICRTFQQLGSVAKTALAHKRSETVVRRIVHGG